MRAGLIALLGLVASAGRSAPERAPAPGTLTVFAAASLTEAFGELGRVAEQRSPGLTVRFNFAGSQQLVAQLQQGAPADVFASADQRWMTQAATHGLLLGAPVMFARNRLAVIVPAANPGHVAGLRDLARPGTKLVLADVSVPAGRYSRDVLARLAAEPGFPADFAARALANVVSSEENVKAVVAKVQLGEADAGIVYRSDVTDATAAKVRVLEIPERSNALAEYPIAVLRAAPDPAAAQAFVALVVSEEGQRVLGRHGLLPGAQTP
jgi:molybdate transport system substrate-binding protein